MEMDKMQLLESADRWVPRSMLGLKLAEKVLRLGWVDSNSMTDF